MCRRALFAAVLGLLWSFSAFGTAQRTFVASTGSDLNSCGRSDPCRSFAAAILQTNASGEVVALDSAGYGPFSITKSMAVIAAPGVHAGISVFTGEGVTINAGDADVIVLRNLYINSQGGANGITLNDGSFVHIEHCVVSGFSGNNINLIPNVSSNVTIDDSVSRQSSNSGIYANSPNGLLRVVVDHCHLQSNRYGVASDRATVHIADSTVTGSGGNPSFYPDYGVFARGSGGTSYLTLAATVVSDDAYGVTVGNADATLTGCTITDHGNIGVNVQAGGVARLTGNTIARNGTGVRTDGTVYATGDNMVDGNGTNTSGATIIMAANKI